MVYKIYVKSQIKVNLNYMNLRVMFIRFSMSIYNVKR